MAKKAPYDTKQSESQHDLILPGVTNYDKLKANFKTKKSYIHRFDAFQDNTFNKLTKDNLEASPTDERYIDQDVYNQMLLNQQHANNWGSRTKQQTSFFSLEPKRKRAKLQSMSSYDMVDEVLTKIVDDLVIDGTQAEYPISIDINRVALENNKISTAFIDKLEKRAHEIFSDVYSMYGFRDEATHKSLWNVVYTYLVEGKKAYAQVFDNLDNPKKVIGLVEIDPLDMYPIYKNGIRFWVHKKTNSRRSDEEILLYDSQVILIDWSVSKINARTSYVEQLIRSFNNVRIMDETRLIWSLTNAMFRTVFKIPTNNLSKTASATVVATEQARYHDDINYNNDTGEVFVNGQPEMKYQKEYWMGDGDFGSPTIETVGGDGPDLNDPNMNDYFNKKFYRNSRVPFSRFDATASETWNLDPQSQLREEIAYGRFNKRIQQSINPLFLKPVITQLVLEFPEIRNDNTILQAITVRYESLQIFEELAKMSVLREKVQFIEEMKSSLTRTSPDGAEEVPYFSQQFLVERYMPEFTKEDLETNKKYLKREHKELMDYTREKAESIAKIEEETGVDITGVGIPRDELGIDSDEE